MKGALVWRLGLGLVGLGFVVACSDSSDPEQPGSGPGGTERAPNVLLISLDTLRADRLGCYGYERPTSPTLDRIAGEGARFLNLAAPSSKTATSHMTMLTGMHPTVHGVRNCYTPETESLNPKIPLLAQNFEAAGYRTAAFTGGGMMTHELGFNRGFEVYEDAGGGADKVFPKAEKWLTTYANSEAKKDDPRPFFLFLHTYEIHDPYTPPTEWQQRFVEADYAGAIDSSRPVYPENAAETWKTDPSFYEAIQARFWGPFRGDVPTDLAHVSNLYDAGIAYTDHLLAGVFGTLRELGLEDQNLLVVITSDHGDEFSEHGQMTHQTLYQGILHVPLIVRWPGHVEAGLQPAALVQGADLTPSILALAGLKPMGAPQGRSWAGAVMGGGFESDEAWSEIGTPLNETASLRKGHYKLLGERKTRRTALFDLDADPGEKNNLGPSNPEVTGQLGARMEEIEIANRALMPKFPTTHVTLGAAAKGHMDALGYTNGKGK